jgi:alanyl-tRNA synthetase
MDKWVEEHCNLKSTLICANEEFDSSDFKNLCKKMADKNFYHEMILYSKNDFSIIACNFEKKDINWGKVFKENIKKFNGAGGGNMDMAQGKFKNQEELLKFVEYISTLLTSQ